MGKLRSLILILFVAVFITACGAGGGGTNVTVSDVGNVEGGVSDTTGAALSGVTVQIGDKTATTGTNGVYSITDLAVGNRTITATKTGYQNNNGTVTVTKGTTVTQNIQMTLTGAGDTTPPTVSSTDPANNATGVAVNQAITVTFSEAMDCSTITTSSFTLKDSSNNAAAGTITTCNNTSAVFTPSSSLAYSTTYTATITTGVKDAAGNAMAGTYSWTFTTASAGGGGTSGSLDTTFGTNGIVTTTVGSNDVFYSVAVNSVGKLIAVGDTSNGVNKDILLVSYNTNGSLDTSFGNNGKVTTDLGSNEDNARAVGIQSDGKIVVAGSYVGSSQDTVLARYNTNGTIDSTFGTNGKVVTSASSFSDGAYDLSIQADGKIVAVGHSNGDFLVLRYNSNGTLDTTFGTNGIVTTDMSTGTDVAFSVAIQTDGKIAVGGGYYDNNNFGFAAVRYNTNGSLDTNFGSGGKTTTIVSNPGAGKGSSIDYTAKLALQSDGKIVMAGNPQTGISYAGADWIIVRYDANGSLDTTFGTAGKVTTDLGGSYEKPYGLVIQTDGKIVAAGGSGTSGTTNIHSVLVRYNADGSLDSNFGTVGKVSTSIGSSFDMFFGVGIQSDGKIVAVGGASNDGTNLLASIARYWQ